MSRRLSLIAVSAVAVAVVAALAVFGLKSSHKAPSKAPQLPSEQLVGSDTTLAGLLGGAHGKPVAVVFWASWCGPCEKEAPSLEAFSHSAEGSGRIVGVDWSDSKNSAKAFLKRYGWTFPVVRDSQGLVGGEYHLLNLPTTFIVDGEGKIRRELHGPQDERSLTRAFAQVQA